MRPRRILLKILSQVLSRYASQPYVVIYAPKFACEDIDHRLIDLISYIRFGRIVLFFSFQQIRNDLL